MRRPRFSIGGLIGFVLAIAFGLAALRNANARWAGITFLVTCGGLTLAVVGTICHRGPSRAWWLGFTLFGWGYMALAFQTWPTNPLRPTGPMTATLTAFRTALGPRNIGPQSAIVTGKALTDHITAAMVTPVSPASLGGVARVVPWDPFLQVGQCLFAWVAACLGGLLSRLAFGTGRPEGPEPVTAPAMQSAPDRTSNLTPPASRRPAAILTGGLGVIAIIGGVGVLSGSPAWGAATSILTACLLGLAVIGAANGPLSLRTSWFAAALFGWGAFLLSFSTDMTRKVWPYVVERGAPLFATVSEIADEFDARDSRPSAALPALLDSPPADDEATLRALQRHVVMSFPVQTSLQDVLNYVRTQTRSPELPDGITVYVDPIALQEVEQTMASTVQADLRGIPLDTSLRLLLKQLSLDYVVSGRLVLILTRRDALGVAIERRYAAAMGVAYDPVQHAGLCVIAVLAAVVGALMAPLICAER